MYEIFFFVCEQLQTASAKLPCRTADKLNTMGGKYVEGWALKLKLIYDRWSVGQSVLMSGAHLEPMTRFFCFLSDDCGFLDVWHQTALTGWVL
jgi:hypothetical protein